MAKEWLNVFTDQAGVSPAGQWISASAVVQVNNATIRIYESDRSGAVTMVTDNMSYGDAEVYLQINFSDGTARFLSGPLHTSVDVSNVASLELTIIFLVGPAGTSYRALVNAHCVYEVL